jgi:hypothetical protein
LPNRHLIDVSAEQKRDNTMKEWAYWVEEHRKSKKEQLRNPLNTWFINNFEKFKLIDGVGWFLSTYMYASVAVSNPRFDISSHTIPYKAIFDE